MQNGFNFAVVAKNCPHADSAALPRQIAHLFGAARGPFGPRGARPPNGTFAYGNVLERSHATIMA